MNKKQTTVLYHGKCPDGFGGAYAAWKKFGDTAEYIPLHYGRPVPENIAGSDIYFIDFCYEKECMDEIAKTATSITVLDHHGAMEKTVKGMPNFVFDETKSGATIAWKYFHPDKEIPLFLQYIEDGDLYKKVSEEESSILIYGRAQQLDFKIWDTLIENIQDKTKRLTIIERGKIYTEHLRLLVRQFINSAKLVKFEGYTCYLSGGDRELITEVGVQLAKKYPPFALIARVEAEGIGVSIRGDGSVDVSEIARRYGGNGHHGASVFRIPWGAPIPWKQIEENSHENTRN